MVAMKADTVAPLGVVDALTAGVNATLRRPGLILIPAVVDLGLWLLPRLTIEGLAKRGQLIWEGLFRLGFGASQPGADDLIAGVRTLITEAGKSINLADAVTGSWFSMPSAIALMQSPRLMLVSDVVLAPFGLSVQMKRIAAAPWQAPNIEIGSFWAALLVTLGCWLIGQLIAAIFLRAASRDSLFAPVQNGSVAAAAPQSWAGWRGLVGLAARLALFTVLLAVLMYLLYLPLGASMLFMAGLGAGAGLIFAIVGGLTLWLLMWTLTSLFFVGEVMTLRGHPLLPGILISLRLVRVNPFRTFSLIILVNVILLGFRVLWGLVGQSAVGGLIAIFANAFLVTAMLLAVYVYFGELWRQEAARAQGQTKTKDEGR